MPRVTWNPIITRAHEIVDASSLPMTLRELHYRLVSEPELGYLNNQQCYKHLSALTAAERRADNFPPLSDQLRGIEQDWSYDSPEQALAELAESYRRDRTEGQRQCLVLGVEKRTLVPLLHSAFDDRGVPVVACAGYESETLDREVKKYVADDGQPAVLIYAGDFDPSGEDIHRNFVAQTGCWEAVEVVALTDDLVRDLSLPESLGKTTDSRAKTFSERHGRLTQVELEALSPEQLVRLYSDAIDRYWDTSEWKLVVAAEAADRVLLLTR